VYLIAVDGFPNGPGCRCLDMHPAWRRPLFCNAEQGFWMGGSAGGGTGGCPAGAVCRCGAGEAAGVWL